MVPQVGIEPTHLPCKSSALPLDDWGNMVAEMLL